MKVSIRKIDDFSEEQVVIECVRVTPEIEEIRAYALAKGEGLSGLSDGGQRERIPLEDVYYFEAVDEKCFALYVLPLLRGGLPCPDFHTVSL